LDLSARKLYMLTLEAGRAGAQTGRADPRSWACRHAR